MITYSQEEISRREEERLSFVEKRDGKEAAVAFAKQGLYVYRSALKERNSGGFRTGYGAAYRSSLIYSCLIYRRYLRNGR
jgi:hypothetical protein